MRTFPAELIFFLVFIAIFLFQYLRKAVARQAESEAAAEVTAPPRVSHPASFDARSLERTEPAAWSATPTSATDFGRRPPAPPAARPGRPRFSRQTLFSSRHDVQKAIVIATIMGPCRAQDPPGRIAGHPAADASRRGPS